jgi:5-methylcytosine-specific restriction endonuclease McrA
MTTSDLMKAMADAGAPFEAILIAVRAVEERDAVVAESRAKEAERTRRYRQRGGGQVSPSMRAQILERDGHACLECSDTECLEIDHIIPLNKGGDPTHPDNLQTLCRPCNARKRDRVRKSDNRGKMRTNEESANVTGAPSLSLPPNENNSNPPTHTHPNTTPRERTPARKGTRLPADWQPEPMTGDTGAVVAVWPPGAIDRELARFRDWAASATGSNSIKSDWQAAWRNWVRRANDEGRYGRPSNTIRAAGGPGAADRRSSLARAIDEGLEWIGTAAQAGVS